MRIYRIEHKELNVGPFNEVYMVSTKETLKHFRRYPAMWTDSSVALMHAYYCACHSLALLCEWFAGPVKQDAGFADLMGDYRVAVFDVPDDAVIIGKSRKQCFFKRPEFSPVITHDNITKFFKELTYENQPENV